jgi:tetratricopeptide (TPR) repeat protein
MKLSARMTAGAALLLILASTVGCTKLKARDQLVRGIDAFKSGKYEQAVDYFQKSVALNPEDPTCRMYLATAYSYEVVPDLDTPENLATAKKAIDGFNAVIADNPNDSKNIDVMRQLASIHRNIKQYDLAKADEMKIISLDPQDSEANYTIGVIDWTQAYKHATDILAAAGLQDDGNGNVKKPKPVCDKMVAANSALIDEGMKYLQQAIAINPTYDAAMEYLQLTYRRKADLECGNDAARKADLAQADVWVQKAMGARKTNEAAKEKRAEHGGITPQ